MYNSNYNNNNNNNQERVQLDKYGNPCIVKSMKSKREDGSFPKCYVTLKGQRYQITISPSKKDGVMAWCTIKKMKNNNVNMQM